MKRNELTEQVNKVVNHCNSKFNALTFEKRMEICQYLSEMQILTIYQLLHRNEDLLCEKWKASTKGWLRDLLKSYIVSYMVEDSEQ